MYVKNRDMNVFVCNMLQITMVEKIASVVVLERQTKQYITFNLISVNCV